MADVVEWIVKGNSGPAIDILAAYVTHSFIAKAILIILVPFH